MVGPILEGPVPHLIGPVPQYTIIWDRSHINKSTKFVVAQTWLNSINNGWMCLSLLLKGETSDTHPHFGFNLKRKPEMLVWFGY